MFEFDEHQSLHSLYMINTMNSNQNAVGQIVVLSKRGKPRFVSTCGKKGNSYECKATAITEE